MGVRGPEGRGETPRTKQTGASDAGARIRNLIPWNGNRSVATSRAVGSGQARWHGSGAGEKFLTGRGVVLKNDPNAEDGFAEILKK